MVAATAARGQAQHAAAPPRARPRRWCSAAITRYSVASTIVSSHASFIRPTSAATNSVGRLNGSHHFKFSNGKLNALRWRLSQTQWCTFAEIKSREFPHRPPFSPSPAPRRRDGTADLPSRPAVRREAEKLVRGAALLCWASQTQDPRLSRVG